MYTVCSHVYTLCRFWHNKKIINNPTTKTARIRAMVKIMAKCKIFKQNFYFTDEMQSDVPTYPIWMASLVSFACRTDFSLWAALTSVSSISVLLYSDHIKRLLACLLICLHRQQQQSTKRLFNNDQYWNTSWSLYNERKKAEIACFSLFRYCVVTLFGPTSQSLWLSDLYRFCNFIANC